MEICAAREESVSTKIKGVVEKILWKNEATGKTIASFKVDMVPKFAKRPQYPNSIVAIGGFPILVKSQELIMKGEWTQDKQKRWSFRVDSYEEVLPTTNEAIVEYLSSGLFKGVGEKTAKAIVEEFGEDSLDVIQGDHEKLTKVRGISIRKAIAIKNSYHQSRHLEELMLTFKPYKISTSKILKISKVYGKNAIKKVENNPYILCDDIDGIGFKIADKIAREFEKKANDDFRIRAGIIHTLNESAILEGHVYLPFDAMVEKTRKTLGEGEISGDIDRNDIIRISIDMNNAKELVMEKDHAVYLPLYYASEVSVGRKVGLITKKQPRAFKYKVEDSVLQLESKYKMKYAKAQKEAFYTLPDSNMMVITGGPGTGKTTIIKGIIEIFKQNFPGSKIVLAAPTGRAAKRMEEATKLEAKTIHRQLEYRPNSEGRIECGRNEHNPIDADLIIIDESSMVDILLFHALLKAVKPDTTLIMVGDIDQLPSVGAGCVLKDLIESNKVPIARLNKIFRQEDTSKIIINAANINNGCSDLEYGEDFVFIPKRTEEIPEEIRKCFLEELAEIKDINEIQVLTPFRRKTENGVEQLNKTLQEAINKKEPYKPEINYMYTTFRKWDKVMQYKNNYDKEIYNGDTGIIKDIKTEEGTMSVIMDGETVEFEKEDLDELQLAYATTIHKSQGCEYDVVIIPLTMQHKRMLQRNLIYTGITRAKKKVILIGDGKALSSAIANNMISNRFSKLKERIFV